MAIKSIELEWDGDPAPFCCPVCGQHLITENPDDTNCDHVLFTYIDNGDAPIYIRDDIREDFPEITKRIEDGEEDDPLEALLNTLDLNSGLCITLTNNGVSCGPCSTTISVGIQWDMQE